MEKAQAEQEPKQNPWKYAHVYGAGRGRQSPEDAERSYGPHYRGSRGAWPEPQRKGKP